MQYGIEKHGRPLNHGVQGVCHASQLLGQAIGNRKHFDKADIKEIHEKIIKPLQYQQCIVCVLSLMNLCSIENEGLKHLVYEIQADNCCQIIPLSWSYSTANVDHTR